MYSYLSHWMQSWNILHIVKDNKTYKAIKQASFSDFILYLRKTPSKRKLLIREKKGSTNFSLIRSFDCTTFYHTVSKNPLTLCSPWKQQRYSFIAWTLHTCLLRRKKIITNRVIILFMSYNSSSLRFLLIGDMRQHMSQKHCNRI